MRYLKATALWVAILLLAGCGQDLPERHMDPTTERYLQEGTQALRHHEFVAALALVDSAEKHTPKSSDAAMLRGRIYSEMGRFEEAEEAYREALDLRPDYPGARLNMGNNAYRQSEYRKAVRYYEAELQHHPGAVPWRGIGRAYVELGAADSAEHAFMQSIGQDSTYAPAHYSLALLYEDEGEFEQALHHARWALRHDPENAGFEYLVGSLMVKTGREEDALPHLRNVVDRQPWHQGAHYNIGQALARIGATEKAQEFMDKSEELRERQARIQHLQSTVRSSPDDPYTQAALGTALRRAGRYNDAMHAYKVASFLAPQDTDIKNNIASLHLIRGDTLRAVREYEAILQEDPSLVDVWVNLGVVYALADRKDSAQQAWQQALRREPDHPRARAYLEKLQHESS